MSQEHAPTSETKGKQSPDKTAATSPDNPVSIQVAGVGLTFAQRSVLRMQQQRGNQRVLQFLGKSEHSAQRHIIQRRRIPTDAALQTELPNDAVGLVQVRPGVARMLARSWSEMSTADQATVRTAAAGFGINFTNENDLRTQLNAATRDQLLQFANAERATVPAATLGDPALIDIGARPHTADVSNINTLVANATTIFTQIASGSEDASIGQIFGTANVAAAKTKYANARTQMDALHTSGHIVTDRSGYNEEVGLGGLTNSAQISVESSVIDNPGDNESVVTFIHESMHAGNNDVHDFGYIGQPSFTALEESVKLTNAAHFEIVPRRILHAANDFAGQTFVPAGTSVGGVAAPALTSREQAIRAASEAFRGAWTVGLNLHTLFVRVHGHPGEWDTLALDSNFSGAAAGSHFSNTLPFWSLVEMLTIHSRTINPAGSGSALPVTDSDVALSEGVVRKLSQGMNGVPGTPADAQTFEAAHASAADIANSTGSVNAERDFLIRLVIRVHLGSITGNLSRDIRVVKRMAQAGAAANFTDMLAIRPATGFP